ncbi:MAG: hypothetical protein CL704_04675 [Chloroflexi bacterium]|nr:hypothetical protein [Chloroflexota bacterium]
MIVPEKTIGNSGGAAYALLDKLWKKKAATNRMITLLYFFNFENKEILPNKTETSQIWEVSVFKLRLV